MGLQVVINCFYNMIQSARENRLDLLLGICY